MQRFCKLAEVTRKLCRRSRTRIPKSSLNGQRKKGGFHRIWCYCWISLFRYILLNGSSSLKKLAEVLKIILILSQGQASVERGFSVNKSWLLQNLATKYLTAQRIVYNYMKGSNVSAKDMEICPTLRRSVKHAK